MPAARKPAAASADEAQAAAPVEAEVVEEKKTNPLDYLQSAMKNVKTQLKAELMTEVNALKGAIDDLAALISAGDDGKVDSELEAIRAEVNALLEGRVTKVDLQGIQESIEQLRHDQNYLADLRSDGPASAPKLTGEYLPGKHILTAIHQVMRAVTFIPKSGEYDGGRSGTYRFRKFDDTAAAIGKAFRDFGVFVQVRTQDRKIDIYEKPYSNGNGSVRWTDAYVQVQYVFTSLEDGSELTVEAYGQGKDNSDKATAKAMTMALKTALTQAFMIPTDEPDPDSERPGDTSADDYSRPVGQGQGQGQQRPAQPPRQQQAAPPREQAPPPRQQPSSEDAAQEKAKRAMAAFAAAHKADSRLKLSKIINQAKTENLLNVEIQSGPETQTLAMWLQAIKHTLPDTPSASPADLPPEPPADY